MDPIAVQPDSSAPAPVVLWDFDETLAAREGRWRSALMLALDRVAPDHGVTMDQVRAGLRDGFPWHAPDRPHLHLDTPELWWGDLERVFRTTYTAAGVSAVHADRAAAAVGAVYVDPQFWTVFEDVRPALGRTRARGFRNVVLSNHVPELEQLVAALGLVDLVDLVLTSAVTGYEKPHPAAFDLALELTGRPAEVWMVGDNQLVDVVGAYAVGIPAILVRTPGADGRSIGLDEAVDQILGISADLGTRTPPRPAAS